MGGGGLGSGVVGEVGRPNPHSPIPNPQSPIPNPQKYKFISFYNLI